VLGPTEIVLTYYLGFGFVVLLAWVVATPDRQLDETAARRYLRWTTIAAVAGVVHPAVALASRDIVGQVGIELPDDPRLRRSHQRTTTIVNTLTVLSALPVVALVALNLA
jgi:hypothetical protein